MGNQARLTLGDQARLYVLVVGLLQRVEDAYDKKDFAIDKALAGEYANYVYASKLLFPNDAFVQILPQEPPPEVVSLLWTNKSAVMQWLRTSVKRLEECIRQPTEQATEEKDKKPKLGFLKDSD